MQIFGSSYCVQKHLEFCLMIWHVWREGYALNPFHTKQSTCYLMVGLLSCVKKDGGVRPIGIGETLRRIIGKSIAKVTGSNVQTAGGLLQTCTGLEAGIEATIHAMARTWQEENCEAVLLIDAENAFNSLNRDAALHNTKRKCPPCINTWRIATSNRQHYTLETAPSFCQKKVLLRGIMRLWLCTQFQHAVYKMILR